MQFDFPAKRRRCLAKAGDGFQQAVGAVGAGGVGGLVFESTRVWRSRKLESDDLCLSEFWQGLRLDQPLAMMQ